MGGAFGALAAQAVADAFAHLAEAATLTPAAGGAGLAVRAIPRQPREGVLLGGRELVRPAFAAEIPASDGRPRKGDRLALVGQVFRVAAAPTLSADGLVWLVELEEAV